MGTVIVTKNGLRIMIRTNDHGLPHVHVVGPDAEAKIYIETLEVERSAGFSEKALRMIVGLIDNNKEKLLEKWSEIHEQD